MKTLKDKIVKELDYGMNLPDRKDIVFFGIWVSRREDGTLTPTLLEIKEEKLTDEIKNKFSEELKYLAEKIKES